MHFDTSELHARAGVWPYITAATRRAVQGGGSLGVAGFAYRPRQTCRRHTALQHCVGLQHVLRDGGPRHQ